MLYENIINIVTSNKWPEGKADPTEFDTDTGKINVRDNYDPSVDSAGWMRHEVIHWLAYHFGIITGASEAVPYPCNVVERYAYSFQFDYMRARGYSFEETLEITGKQEYRSILIMYWNASARNTCHWFEYCTSLLCRKDSWSRISLEKF